MNLKTPLGRHLGQDQGLKSGHQVRVRKQWKPGREASHEEADGEWSLEQLTSHAKKGDHLSPAPSSDFATEYQHPIEQKSQGPAKAQSFLMLYLHLGYRTM